MSKRQLFVMEQTELIADVIDEVLHEEGFVPQEAIPGLIQAIYDLSKEFPDPDGALDLAISYLSDTERFEAAKEA